MEHLIDRESELGILRRLARKRIGPRLLGTFSNGRFEQFFQARTLTADDLRVPETSKHIAKRMRELHEGVELLEEERAAGAFVWQNWEKWVERCEEVISWLDEQIISKKVHRGGSVNEAWRSRDFVCGVEWPMFRRTVEQYRAWLESTYDGSGAIKEDLVFSHNDVSFHAFTSHAKILTQVADAIRQLTSPSAQRRIPTPHSCQRAQAAYRHRF